LRPSTIYPAAGEEGMEGDRLKSIVELVRRIRHDANNPITAALGHVQLLLEDPAVQDEEVLESLRVVESELRRLTEILRRLNEVRLDDPGENTLSTWGAKHPL
jgi:signal transduction histidine kinase